MCFFSVNNAFTSILPYPHNTCTSMVLPVNLTLLTHTLEAPKFHILTVVVFKFSSSYQIPKNVGWKFQKIQILTKIIDGDHDVLKMIFCKCLKGCGRAYRCR